MIEISYFFKLFNKKQKIEACVLILLFVLSTILETLGLGLILPILSMMTQKSSLQWPWLSQQGLNQVQITIVLLLALALFYTLKVPFLMYLSWKQPQFSYNVGVSWSQSLLGIYLNQPYEFHLWRNSAQLISNLTSEVYQVIQHGLLCLMKVISEGLILLGVISIMLYVEPLGTSIIAILLLVVALKYQHFLRSKLLQWGKSRQYHEEKRMQCIQQALGSIKETVLLGRESSFLKQHLGHASCVAYSHQMYEMIDGIPRLWLEWFSVIA